MRVIDGMHRLSAARRLGLETVRVEYFDGTTEEARIEAIRANNSHGLPLTLEERRTSAVAILVDNLDWSDRRVAGICGLSPKTVAALRPSCREVSDEVPQEHRIGRDGLARRIRRSNTRARVLAALAEDPDASLRTVAERAGTSPETVRTIRRSLAAGDEGAALPATAAAAPSEASPLPDLQHGRRWSADVAISSTPEGSAFGSWFDRSDISDDDIAAHLDVIPLSRVYEVIDDALRRARAWEAFGCRLRARVR
jgi:ParB-like chromosome segregation protein Spo0J